MHYQQWVKERLNANYREFWLFLAGLACFGFASSLVDSTFNNFLSESFAVGNLQRAVIEFPREVPGLLVMFVSAGLFFLHSRRLAALAMVLAAAGAAALGLFPGSFSRLLAWLFVYSLGQHLFLPLNSSLGMELARDGQTGRRLGQFNAVRNAVTILGSFVIVLGFKYLGLTFAHSFLLAALALAVAAVCFGRMRPVAVHPPSVHLKLHREYRTFYALTVLFGARKQIFLTFAPWVLVTVYAQPTQAIASLLTLGGVVGILFQPWLGRLIDSWGERRVLTTEAILLVGVCLLYGFAGRWFAPGTALVVVAGCYVADQLLMSVSMARATYLRKIAVHPSHVAPTLAAATSIDHVFSISTALVCGVIWQAWGFPWVFVLGAGIALVNILVARRVRTGERLG